MEIQTLVVESRKPAGTREAARLRRAGKLPAVLYGHKLDPVHLAMSSQDLETLLQKGAHLVNLNLGSEEQACLIKAVQYNYLGDTPVHVDLARVDLNERVQVYVQIELRGTPKGIGEGGALQRGLKEIEIACLVANIPESIRLDVSHLALDDVLHVKDIELPEGAEAISDPEAAIVMIRVPAAQKSAIATGEGEGEGEEKPEGEEPEVIAKGKAEEESDKAAS